jgi:hypothetical protein
VIFFSEIIPWIPKTDWRHLLIFYAHLSKDELQAPWGTWNTLKGNKIYKSKAVCPFILICVILRHLCQLNLLFIPCDQNNTHFALWATFLVGRCCPRSQPFTLPFSLSAGCISRPSLSGSLDWEGHKFFHCESASAILSFCYDISEPGAKEFKSLMALDGFCVFGAVFGTTYQQITIFLLGCGWLEK